MNKQQLVEALRAADVRLHLASRRIDSANYELGLAEREHRYAGEAVELAEKAIKQFSVAREVKVRP